MIPREYYEGPGWEPSLHDVGIDLREADERLRGVLFAIARIPERFRYVDDENQAARYDVEPPLFVVFRQESPIKIRLVCVLRQPVATG